MWGIGHKPKLSETLLTNFLKKLFSLKRAPLTLQFFILYPAISSLRTLTHCIDRFGPSATKFPDNRPVAKFEAATSTYISNSCLGNFRNTPSLNKYFAHQNPSSEDLPQGPVCGHLSNEQVNSSSVLHK